MTMQADVDTVFLRPLAESRNGLQVSSESEVPRDVFRSRPGRTLKPVFLRVISLERLHPKGCILPRDLRKSDRELRNF